MNPIVAQQIRQITQRIQELHGILDERQDHARQQLEQIETLRLEQFRMRKELATVKRLAEDYDALNEETERLRAQHAELRESLTKILGWTKALNEGLRS